MANRIPPSLKWLIDKRARISGEIEKTRRSLERTQSLIDELEDLETKLKAIDTAYGGTHYHAEVRGIVCYGLSLTDW